MKCAGREYGVIMFQGGNYSTAHASFTHNNASVSLVFIGESFAGDFWGLYATIYRNWPSARLIGRAVEGVEVCAIKIAA